MATGRGVDVVVETVIDRPVAQVSAYAGDPANAPTWYSNIASVEWHTPPPLEVGSRMDFVASFLGRRLAYTHEVSELEPGRRHPHDPRECGHPQRLREGRVAPDGGRRTTGHHQGPAGAQAAARSGSCYWTLTDSMETVSLGAPSGPPPSVPLSAMALTTARLASSICPKTV